MHHVKGFAGMFLVASLAMGAASSAAAHSDPALARQILRELIDTRSTHDVGSTELARKIQARLIAAGFAPAAPAACSCGSLAILDPF